MRSRIFLEGGPPSDGEPNKHLDIECRQSFRRLLESCGLRGRVPRLVACGSRSSAFREFSAAHRAAAAGDYVAMLIDSEDPVADSNKLWDHLRVRDGWRKPAGAKEEQVLLMVTCMETWIVADRPTLRKHYGSRLQDSALPSLRDLEVRHRDDVQERLARATRNCTNAYEKGTRSFLILEKLSPDELHQHLPSFRRTIDVLKATLPPA